MEIQHLIPSMSSNCSYQGTPLRYESEYLIIPIELTVGSNEVRHGFSIPAKLQKIALDADFPECGLEIGATERR